MECNQISMRIDVKLEIYDKRPDSLKFKVWTQCKVKIEAIKCLPCFLRINVQTIPQDGEDDIAQLNISVNVPSVTVSLASSRTKEYVFGLFWTHNRRDCFIYFAFDSSLSCRKHMKWIKKAIKNLEVYRQIFLEERRNSREPTLFPEVNIKSDNMQLSAVKDALSALGPLPQIPDINSSINWSRRVSRASDMYEEIYEGNIPPRLSRRLSHTSVSSGIYEEMKPHSLNIDAILEEQLQSPPPLPPLPPLRKRLNTFESDPLGLLGDIPRSNTNPEPDLVKKKNHKTPFTNGRSKRSDSLEEISFCTVDDLIKARESIKFCYPIYTNDIIKQQQQHRSLKANNRNSFSSPDLSKINFLDTFDEEKVAALMQLNRCSDLDAYIDDDLDSEDFAVGMQNASALAATSALPKVPRTKALISVSGSLESLNVTGQLPQDFNFSACNSSSINLVGASGAVPSINKLKLNKIMSEDDLTGYCVMAPITSKKLDNQESAITATSLASSSSASGYCTGSYSYSHSSTNSSYSATSLFADNKETQQEIFKGKQNLAAATNEGIYDELPSRKTPLPVSICDIYENIQPYSPVNNNNTILKHTNITPTSRTDFPDILYENLLTIKAAQELEQPLLSHICTSTPTDSPADEKQPSNDIKEQYNLYKTPRKSMISIDDKIPSYYPNSCDAVKMRRRSDSLSKEAAPTSVKSMEKKKSSMGLKNLVNIKLKRERKENVYLTSPQQIIEQRKNSSGSVYVPPISTTKSKKSSNAHKISENVYTVNLSNKKSLQLYNNNNEEISAYKEITETGQLKEKPLTELVQLALLQKINFKFDDMSTQNESSASPVTSSYSDTPMQSGIAKLEQAELEYENCYQATKDATRLLHKYATMVPKQQLQHHLQPNQSSNQKNLPAQSTKLALNASPCTDEKISPGVINTKKFTSLPRFKKIDLSPLKHKINNVLQRNQTAQ